MKGTGYRELSTLELGIQTSFTIKIEAKGTVSTLAFPSSFVTMFTSANNKDGDSP